MALLNKIKEFTGAYRREGLNIVNLQGKQYLTRGFKFFEHRSSQNNSAKFSNLETIKAFSSINFSVDVESSKREQIVGLDDGGRIYLFSDSFVTDYDIGEVNKIPFSTSDNIAYISNPGVNTTTNNNIFYTNASYLGCAYRFKADSATSTSITVTGETFYDTYGINDKIYNSHIYNITKGEAYDNTKTQPTDTLEFSTADTTPEGGDIFMVFVDNAFSFNTPIQRGNHFASQDYPSDWTRQIQLSNNHYYILNGNYIARIDVSDNDASSATMEAEWQQLHRGRQALCFDMNKENILVGTTFRGRYELFLYNEYSFGSLDSISLPGEPKSIVAYESGWLVLAGATLYYTNGSQLEKLSTLPDFEDTDSDPFIPPNGMNYKNDNIFIFSDGSADRYGRGLFVYNTEQGWSFTPVEDDDISARYNLDLGAIIKYKDRIFSGYSVLGSTRNYVIGELNESGGKKRIGLLFHFDQTVSIKEIGITLSEVYDLITSSDKSTDITVNYSNTRKPLHLSNISVGDNNTTTSINFPDGSIYHTAVGQKVLFVDKNIAGESTYITDISNKGTSDETWTVSPELSAAPNNDSFIIKYNLYKAGTKTVDVTNIPQDIRFSTNFYGDILYLEVELSNGLLDLSNIKLYG